MPFAFRLVAALCFALATAASSALAQDTPATAAMAKLRNDLVIGPANAPHALDLYVSYTCPHCRDYWAAELPAVENDLVKAGKLRINVRPAIFNNVDLIVSMAVGCAPDGKRKALVTAIYADQPELMTAASGGQLREFILERLAAQGVPDAAAQTCMKDEAKAQRIVDGFAAATKAVLPQMQALYNDDCRARTGRECQGIMTPLHVLDGKLISSGGLAELKSLVVEIPQTRSSGKALGDPDY